MISVFQKEMGKNAFQVTAERIPLQEGKMWPLKEEMKELGWLKAAA
jgi:hypothetical protein